MRIHPNMLMREDVISDVPAGPPSAGAQEHASGVAINPAPSASSDETRVTLCAEALARSRGGMSSAGRERDTSSHGLYGPGPTGRGSVPASPAGDDAAVTRAQLTARLASEYPSLREAAKQAIESRLLQEHGVQLDADRTFYNVFDDGTYGWGTGFAKAPLTSVSLTDLQLRNCAQLRDGGEGGRTRSGIYTENRGAAIDEQLNRYNRLALSPADVEQAAWDSDFYDRYRHQLNAYWDKNLDAVATLLKLNVLQAARGHGLSAQATDMLAGTMGADANGAGIAPQGVTAHVFDINAYPSRDMTWLQADNGHVVLLMPGDRQSVREYADADRMREDIAAMTRSEHGRRTLASHFSIYERQDGIIYQGVDKWLGDIAGGGYDNRIAYDPQAVSGNVFSDQAARMRHAALDDAQRLVRSNAEMIWEEIGEGVESINAFCPNFLTEGIALGINLHEASQGDSTEDRRQATLRACANMAMLVAMTVEEDEGPSAAGMHAVVRAGEAAVSRLPYFHPPTRLADGRVGYPMSPTDPPRLLDDVYSMFWESDPRSDDELSLFDESSSSDDDMQDFDPAMPLREGAAGAAGMLSFNGRGVIERRDISAVYRIEPVEGMQGRNPVTQGFTSSEHFDLVDQMIEGPSLITYDTLFDASKVAEWRYGRGNYNLYRIDARGLRAASQRENELFNPGFATMRRGRDTLAEQMSTQRIVELFEDRFTPAQLAGRHEQGFEAIARAVARNALHWEPGASEVHIDNAQLTTDTTQGGQHRITLLEGIA